MSRQWFFPTARTRAVAQRHYTMNVPQARGKRIPAYAGGGAVRRQRYLPSAEALLLRIL